MTMLRDRGPRTTVVVGNAKETARETGSGNGKERGNGDLREMIEEVTAIGLVTGNVPKTEIVKEIATGTQNATVGIVIGLLVGMGMQLGMAVVEAEAEVLV